MAKRSFSFFYSINFKRYAAIFHYCGGIFQITTEIFEEVNGFSNGYWGYGHEDHEICYRIENRKKKAGEKEPKLKIGMIRGVIYHFCHLSSHSERNDYFKDKAMEYYNDRYLERRKFDGLNNLRDGTLKFSVTKRIKTSSYFWVGFQLNYNPEDTTKFQRKTKYLTWKYKLNFTQWKVEKD